MSVFFFTETLQAKLDWTATDRLSAKQGKDTEGRMNVISLSNVPPPLPPGWTEHMGVYIIE
jgi:hypothetical protein